jgi:hypothetical protein
MKATHNNTSETNNKKDGLKVLCKQKKFSYCKAFFQPEKKVVFVQRYKAKYVLLKDKNYL